MSLRSFITRRTTLIALIAAIAILGVVLWLGFSFFAPAEIAALSVQIEPSGASIFLDGKPPQMPPNTFIHVPFGTHQLTATLKGFEPLDQSIDVRREMTPEIRLALKWPTPLASPSHSLPTFFPPKATERIDLDQQLSGICSWHLSRDGKAPSLKDFDSDLTKALEDAGYWSLSHYWVDDEMDQVLRSLLMWRRSTHLENRLRVVDGRLIFHQIPTSL